MSDENPKVPEPIAEFFNRRADTYEAHMQEDKAGFDQQYDAVCACIPVTPTRLSILDVGCGTGLEFKGIFNRAPNAVITGIDVAEEMLRRLKINYGERLQQITLIHDSYLSYPFGEDIYDYAVSVWSLHHLLPATKRNLYIRIRKALKPGGKFVEGDYGVSADEESQSLQEYYEKSKGLEGASDGSYHIDISLSRDTQVHLLRAAGFSKVDVVWHGGNAAVFMAVR
jgi:tRNA (cmo5U34)-methyltransferase